VTAIGDVLAGSGRPFLLASGVATPRQGQAFTEHDKSPFHGLDAPRGGSENLALEYVDRDVKTISLRFAPTVHGAGDHGFIAFLVEIARTKGVAGYPADGTNRWPAIHRSDAAQIIRLGLDKAPAGAILHAVSEEGISTRQIAEAIGRGLDLPVASVAPEDTQEHFGWIGNFFALDIPASSTLTQELLGWTPSGPTLIEDLDAGAYFPV
jgi:nucleoside-diphosphate-sugar epimerase